MARGEETEPVLTGAPAADPRKPLPQWAGLRQVFEAISGEVELRPLLAQVARAACDLLEADVGLIGLVDEARQTIRIEGAWGAPLVPLGLEFGPGVGLAGQVWLSDEPLFLDRGDQLDPPLLPELADYAMMGVPICRRGPVIGVLGVGAARPGQFCPQDAELLALLAHHAAIAIENARLYQAEKRRASHIAIINRVGRLVSSSLHLDHLLQTAVEATVTYLRHPHIAILLADPAKPDTLVLRAKSGIFTAPEINPYHQTINQGIIGTAARTRQRRLVNNVRRDPHYLRLPGADNIYAELAVPIVVGDRLLGVLNVESEQPISEADAEGYEIIADQLGVAIDNARLFAEVRSALEQARLLYETSHLLYERDRQIAVLQERQRLARELHDSVTQLIFSVTLIAQSISPAWRRDPAEAERRIARLLELSQLALVEMRALLAELRPAEAPQPAVPAHSLSGPPVPGFHRIQQEGLVSVLRQHLAGVTGEGLAVDFDPAAYIPQDTGLEEALYRITQEALNNVLKHARARQVRVRLATDGQASSLTVTDDGIGLPEETGEPEARPGGGTGRGLGLRSMRERAAALGGVTRLAALPEGGTMVAVTIPRKDRLT